MKPVLFKNWYKRVIKSVWYRLKDRHTNQWNRTESRKNLQVYGQMIFDKSVKTTQGKG